MTRISELPQMMDQFLRLVQVDGRGRPVPTVALWGIAHEIAEFARRAGIEDEGGGMDRQRLIGAICREAVEPEDDLERNANILRLMVRLDGAMQRMECGLDFAVDCKKER